MIVFINLKFDSGAVLIPTQATAHKKKKTREKYKMHTHKAITIVCILIVRSTIKWHENIYADHVQHLFNEKKKASER